MAQTLAFGNLERQHRGRRAFKRQYFDAHDAKSG
jgi:hypothetical protein